MQEAEGRTFSLGQTLPVGPHALQQAHGTDHVGLDEVLGAMDGTVHMTLGREIEYSARRVLRQQLFQQGRVTNIALHKLVTGITLQAGQIFGVACVRQLVQVEHRLSRLTQPVEHKVGSNKTCPTCNQNHCFPPIGSVTIIKAKKGAQSAPGLSPLARQAQK